MSGTLYLVATPIGNLEDITLRAIRILKEVDLIAAEDTRHSLKLLNHLEISKPLISYHRHNEDTKTNILIEKLLEGQNVALITDAGTPAISDPGEYIVKVAIENNIKIVPIPGACALINALIVSGFNTREFCFYGFLPLNKKLRNSKFEELKKEHKTIILYEAPHKIKNTLQDILEKIGDVNIVLAREITKIHESFIRAKCSEILKIVDTLKGEMIILIENNTPEIPEQKCQETLEEQFERLQKEGLKKTEIIKRISKENNLDRNDVYKKFIGKNA